MKNSCLFRKGLLCALLPVLLLNLKCSSSPRSKKEPKSCTESENVYQKYSRELQRIAEADQADRNRHTNMHIIEQRDLKRRIRVAELFAKDCLRSSADYAAAALVFQHGSTPDHFLQTYIWAKKAVELGDKHQQRLMTLGLDRYLVNTGHRQLFATQALKPNTERCWCLAQTEPSFPKNLKIKYSGRSLQDEINWLQSLNKNEKDCSKVIYCKQKLKPTTKNVTFGLWN